MRSQLLLPIAIGVLCAGTSLAQVPNGGFENWTDMGTYLDPDGWITFNGLTSLAGASPSCEQGSPGAVGNYYATVTTQNTAFGVIQGILTTGDGTTGQTGFAFSSRPAAFTGKWQYGIQPQDTGLVVVYLTKWNNATQNSDSVGGGAVQLLGSLSGWQNMNIPITYFSSADPDTAFVMIASSLNAPVEGSFVKVDDLSLGISTGVAQLDQVPGLRIWPSPATDEVNVAAADPISAVNVMDLTGRTVLTKAMGAAQATLVVADLPPGRYLMQVNLIDGRRQVRSFIKQ